MHNSLSQLLSRHSSRYYWTNNKHVILLRRLSRQRREGSTSSVSRPFQSSSRPLWSTHLNNTNSHQYCHHRALSTSLAPQPDNDEDDDHVDDKRVKFVPVDADDDDFSLDDEIEALAASCFPLDDHEDIHDDIRHLRQQRLRMEHSSLDLELGDTSVWDSPEEIMEDDYDSDGEEEASTLVGDDNSSSIDNNNPLDFPAFPQGTPAAELHRQQLQKQSASPKRYKPVLSPLDMLERLSLDHPTATASQQPISDSLSYMGPPPTPSLHTADNTTNKENKNLDEQELRQLQLQLECEAQQEAVQKYRRLTDQTRSRKDYASLNSLQKLILHWYQPMRDEIDTTQRSYIFRKTHQQQRTKQKQDDNNEDGETTAPEEEDMTAIHRYGPLLNTVEPEKLAVICAHEALTFGILKAQEKHNYGGGCSVVQMALKLGQAVEDEVLLQRILKQKMMEAAEAARAAAAQAEELHDETTTDTVHNQSAAAAALGSFGATPKSDKWSYAESRLNSYLQELAGDGGDVNVNAKNKRNIAYAVRRARRSLSADDWTNEDKLHVGTILLKILLDNATIRLPDGTIQPAFRMEQRWHNNGKHNKNKHNSHRFKSSNHILIHDALWKLAVADEFESIAASTTRHKPMVIPPEQWTSPTRGGYAWLKTDLIRFHGSQMQREALDEADLTTVLDGLNALGREPWVINKTILAVANECWEHNIPLGDIPSRTDFEVPPEPTPPERTSFLNPEDPEFDEAHVERQKKQWVKEYTSFKEARNRHRRFLQKNRDLFSLRCSASLKLAQAQQFQDFESIYFPYNMDFRGRAYPVPPHLSNVGSDLCRGVLKFAKSKPLGKRGLFWLHVHLANLAGKDKMTFEERAQYSIDNLDNIRKSVKDPLGRDSTDNDDDDDNSGDPLGRDSTDDDDDNSGERPWWMSLDDPFQGLATCHEIVNAIDSGNPETYMCSLPVHMDGSCNGLQHYAALGLDPVGGTAVNLCDYPEPQDVYIGVMEEVIRRVAEESERDLGFDDTSLKEEKDEKAVKKKKKELYRNKSAKLVNGLIDRGVVKRTVMTSVYGVTYIGARTQIQEKIEEKFEEQGRDLDEANNDIFAASGYLAQVTMDVIGDLFTGAKQTMNWLTQCARLISAKGYPVAWMTPLGLPAIQPYRQKRTSKIVTALASVLIADFSDDLPIHKSRSVSAFPPNYIHSLDSTHMLMTALEMDRRGLSFSAVHDSFWTHPGDIDEMNEALRDQFVELYSQPLLEELKESFEMRYPDIDFPDLPEKGDLDLEEVKNSKFFFQ